MSSPPAVVTAELLEPLRLSLSPAAQLLLPTDAAFASTIDSWNHDFRSASPAAAVLPASTADISAALRFFHAHALPFTVGCGLHSRWSKRDGHVLLYLGLLRGVSIDAASRTARVQGGARNADLDRAGGLCCPPLHTPAGTNPDTGVGGLILGGGVGYLSRRQGMSIDNLLEVELVTYDGTVVRASERQHAELFWAVRGAGFNFGVVSEFVLRLYDDVGHQLRQLDEHDEAVSTRHGLPEQPQLVDKVLMGLMPYPKPAFTRIADVIQRQYIQPASSGPLGDRDLYLGLVLANGPSGPACIVAFVYVGDAYKGYRALDTLIEAIGAPLAPVQAVVRADTYVALQHMLDEVTEPGHYYERSFMSAGINEHVAAAMLAAHDELAQYPTLSHSALTTLVLGVDGKMQENSGIGAFSAEQRKGNVLLGVIASWDDGPDGRTKAVQWANTARQLVLPHCSSIYTNSVSGQAGSRDTFGSSLQRLRRVKQQWDPHNVFCNNQNVVPADQDEAAVQTAQLDLN